MVMQEHVDIHGLQSMALSFARQLSCGDVVCLHGDLGAGKTAFVKACLEAMVGTALCVPSPTFTLCQTYETPQGDVHHYDLYRLEEPHELDALGLVDMQPEVITFIEWPALALPRLPHNAFHVIIEITSENGRTIRINTAERTDQEKQIRKKQMKDAQP